jgi:hypothetical protein
VSQQRAEAAARDLALAITGLNEPPHGEYAIEIRVTCDPHGIAYVWDWWWRPLGISRGASAVDAAIDSEPGPEQGT